MELLEQNLDKFFSKIVYSYPREMFDYIKANFNNNIGLLLNNNFKIELVIDTNILFKEVRSFVLYKNSFFLKISDNPFIKLYGPPQLKEELYEKIKLKFSKDKKTKNIDLNYCLQIAEQLLDRITIVDSKYTGYYQKAKDLIGERDKKDIPFLALSFSYNTHGILTSDKDFKIQNEVKIWELKRVGKIVGEFKKGYFSLFLLDFSFKALFEFFAGLISSVWGLLIEMIEKLIQIFTSIIKGELKAILKLPKQLIYPIIILFFISKSIREYLRVVIDKIWNYFKKIMKSIEDTIISIYNVLKNIYEDLKPFLSISADIFIYLILNTKIAIIEFRKLEKVKPL